MIDSIVDQQLTINTTRHNRKTKQGKLLLVSLLENFCDLYDSNQMKNKRLFSAICMQLSSMGVLLSIYLSYVDVQDH